MTRVIGVVLVAAVLWLTTEIGSQAPARAFPDVSSRIGVLTDQLPSGMTDAQIRFAATRFIGSQKLTIDITDRLRRVNPAFLVLHYRLAMWQTAPEVAYIVDGQSWSNDFPFVDTHEGWFWHNTSGQRVVSKSDRKLLMNIADPEFRAYWRESIASQVAAGDYDGVFLDSASPALLQGEAGAPVEPRLAGTGARDTRMPELGGRTWIEAWEDWIADLDASLAARGIALVPNVGQFITTWDKTDYSLSAGAFSEGYLDPSFAESDWKDAVDQTLKLVGKDRIVILQNYLRTQTDIARRKYLLANYLLVKGARTYVFYFADTALVWYPEWSLDLGRPLSTAATAEDLSWNGLYRREFAKGTVLVNPSPRAVHVDVGRGFRRVDLVGGGPVDASGAAGGRLTLVPVRTIDLAPTSAEILLHD